MDEFGFEDCEYSETEVWLKSKNLNYDILCGNKSSRGMYSSARFDNVTRNCMKMKSVSTSRDEAITFPGNIPSVILHGKRHLLMLFLHLQLFCLQTVSASA